MEKLDLIKEHIKNHKKISDIPGFVPLKKLEDIELKKPLILRQNGNGKPTAKIKIIIPKEIKKGESYSMQVISYTPQYDIENAEFKFIEKKDMEIINSNQLKENSIVRKWYKIY